MIKLPWVEYRKFAIQLFGITDAPHTVAGVQLDGTLGTADCLIFNFQKPGFEDVVIDEAYVDELARQLGDKAGREFFVVAPASRVTFLQDYIPVGDTQYYILRIPYSIIDELHRRGTGEGTFGRFKQLQQPGSEKDVNSTMDAVGFDFIQAPEVECDYIIQDRHGGGSTRAIVRINIFRTEAMLREDQTFDNHETLSIVMVNYAYANGDTDGMADPFQLDQVFYADQLIQQGWEVYLDADRIGAQVMLIYVDIFGNELREIKTIADFTPASAAAAQTRSTLTTEK